MSVWRDVPPGHRVQLLGPGPVELLWEHDCPPGYSVARHMVGSSGAHWTVESVEPLTLSPSVHCDPARGGCGTHGFIRDGRWS